MKENGITSKPKLVYAAVLALLGTMAFPYILRFGDHSLAYTNSVISVFVFLIFTFLLYKAFLGSIEGNWRGWFFPALFGFFFCACMIVGSRLDEDGKVDFGDLGMWFSLLILSIIISIIVRFVWVGMEDILEKKACDESVTKNKKRNTWLISTGIILACYIPVFLAAFPGFFVYDAQDELVQVITRNFTTHHPLTHVLFMGGIIQLGYKLTGSYNVGIACYTVIQMIIMAGIFGFCVDRMNRKGLSKVSQTVATLYFGLCPVLVMFSICSAKDGLFAGMLLLMVMCLQNCCADTNAFFSSKKDIILFIIAALGMMLMRYNGVYAYLVFIPIFTIYLRKYWKKVLLLLVGTAVAYLLLSNVLAYVLRANTSESQEFLTVPIMQMTRVYLYNKESLTKEDIAILNQYLPEEALEMYNPKISDMVKANFENQVYRNNKADFLKLWTKWGMKYPSTYLNAWFLTSYGFWYPDTVIDVYRGNTVFTFTYQDSSYFGYEVEQPGSRESKFPWLDEFYRTMSIEIAQQKVPVISMLFSPGFIFWLTIFILGYFCYYRRYEKVFPFIMPLLCWLTFLLGPTYLVRYVVFLWVLLPVLMGELRHRDLLPKE